ncbi:DUF397 domain-containing protein [Streptomyces sp. A3M-1-3]|uniref:DUF397 domain-containing protein n=1 Tax=Streptomyces sp. A3M-1-3 TaxID=2962044 RepID=UPI0020B6C053|nr:DUF397 domain-containing protein [Streptomyces sp. A3M-1-3]MCP3822039.1 DUF397 domain-containing protein [Streptomyces sp. A3M-1-3]
MTSTEYDLSTAHWRKSSYSGGSGGDCVEVAEDFPGAAEWRKSSYSDGSGGDCVEVADNLSGIVPVRDSKAQLGPALVFRAGSWSSFVSAVKNGQLRAP